VNDSSGSGTASSLPISVDIPGYRLRRQAGVDALGLWFDAEQESLGRKVTLKVLRPQYERHDGARREFLAEMDRLAALHHRNLPQVLDSSHEGLLFLVVERCGPDTLQTLLEPGKPVAEAVALRAAKGVAAALACLVEHDLAYRNVTPSLVGLREDGGVRLATFRNVITMDELRGLRGRLAQDAAYVAPEQLAGEEPIGAATHSYHVAALLFHLLAARPPHGTGTPTEIARAHLTQPFPSLRRFQPFLSRGIYTVIEACTQRAPGDRPGPAQLADALAALADGKDPGFEAPAKAVSAPRPRRRRRRR